MLVNIQSNAYSTILEKKTKALEKANKDRTLLQLFVPEEQVMFYSNWGHDHKNKLTTLWTGLLEILEKNRPDSYMFKDLNNG